MESRAQARAPVGPLRRPRRDGATNGPIVVGIVYGLAFVPLMYFTDGFVYRRWERRKTGKPTGKKTG